MFEGVLLESQPRSSGFADVILYSFCRSVGWTGGNRSPWQPQMQRQHGIFGVVLMFILSFLYKVH